MAHWVDWRKAKDMRKVAKHNKKEKTFRNAAIAEARGSHVWARYRPNLPGRGIGGVQVDVTSATVIG